MREAHRRGSQVVRPGSAKPLFVGSIPTRASNVFSLKFLTNLRLKAALARFFASSVRSREHCRILPQNGKDRCRPFYLDVPEALQGAELAVHHAGRQENFFGLLYAHSYRLNAQGNAMLETRSATTTGAPSTKSGRRRRDVALVPVLHRYQASTPNFGSSSFGVRCSAPLIH